MAALGGGQGWGVVCSLDRKCWGLLESPPPTQRATSGAKGCGQGFISANGLLIFLRLCVPLGVLWLRLPLLKHCSSLLWFSLAQQVSQFHTDPQPRHFPRILRQVPFCLCHSKRDLPTGPQIPLFFSLYLHVLPFLWAEKDNGLLERPG